VELALDQFRNGFQARRLDEQRKEVRDDRKALRSLPERGIYDLLCPPALEPAVLTVLIGPPLSRQGAGLVLIDQLLACPPVLGDAPRTAARRSSTRDLATTGMIVTPTLLSNAECSGSAAARRVSSGDENRRTTWCPPLACAAS
jgi:hypothetical protein